ncbi:hypothetical protein KBTX_01586 [wastewater metagenome]|uniref:Uncharacterized protein n=2 Tax=unclassified sequences TaxID=12908 RepID=A0A5B8R934_9ZZZZ|nr:hypothetical protein KBTEX_01586 [uncultured organism]
MIIGGLQGHVHRRHALVIEEPLAVALPGQAPAQTVADHRTALAVHGLDADVDGGRCGTDRLQRAGELVGGVGGEVTPAGGLGETGELVTCVGLLDAEADHVGGEAHPGLLQPPPDFAGIEVAGLTAVGDQDHAGAVLAVLERLRRLPDGRAERRLALGREPVDRLADGRPRPLPGLDQHLDIAAVALATVAIGNEAEHVRRIAGLDQVTEDTPGDGDLGLAVDPAPHGPGGIENEHGIGRGRRAPVSGRGRRGSGERHDGRARRAVAGSQQGHGKKAPLSGMCRRASTAAAMLFS